MVGPGCSDDRRRDERVAQDPRQRDLGHADAAGFGQLLHGADDGFVIRGVERLDDLVGAGAEALLTRRAGEAALGPAYSAGWVARTILRTARYPRRDAMVFPSRAVHLAEPVLGGLLDHVLGESRRRRSPRLIGPGTIEEGPPDLDFMG